MEDDDITRITLRSLLPNDLLFKLRTAMEEYKGPVTSGMV